MTKKEKWLLAGGVTPFVAMPLLLLAWAIIGVLVNIVGMTEDTAVAVVGLVSTLFGVVTFLLVLGVMAAPVFLVLFFLERSKRTTPPTAQYQPPQPQIYPPVPPTDLLPK